MATGRHRLQPRRRSFRRKPSTAPPPRKRCSCPTRRTSVRTRSSKRVSSGFVHTPAKPRRRLRLPPASKATSAAAAHPAKRSTTTPTAPSSRSTFRSTTASTSSASADVTAATAMPISTTPATTARSPTRPPRRPPRSPTTTTAMGRPSNTTSLQVSPPLSSIPATSVSTPKMSGACARA